MMDLSVANLAAAFADGGKDHGVDRLVLAAADQLATRGAAETSARSVAAAAGAAPSAINYNFGGVERLFCRAFSHGAAIGSEWADRCRLEIAALPKTPQGAALALEHVVSEWTGGARPLALLYQEALAGWPGGEPAIAWTAVWRDFWSEAALVFRLPPAAGGLLHAFFQSESLYHLSRWSPALERAALREMCGHLVGVWLEGERPAPTGALELAERSAGVLRDGAVNPSAMKIAEAAAELVEEAGLTGLTHRGVAARAGVTTGAVTHHFRTIEDLVAGAIRGQVQAVGGSGVSEARPTQASLRGISSPERLFATIRAHIVSDRPGGPALRRRHLFLAAMRRPELVGAGAVIRFAHGGTVGEALIRFFRMAPEQRSLHAGVLARLLAASWFACQAEPSPRQAQAALVDEILGRLQKRL